MNMNMSMTVTLPLWRPYLLGGRRPQPRRAQESGVHGHAHRQAVWDEIGSSVNSRRTMPDMGIVQVVRVVQSARVDRFTLGTVFLAVRVAMQEW